MWARGREGRSSKLPALREGVACGRVRGRVREGGRIMSNYMEGGKGKGGTVFAKQPGRY